MLIQWKNNKKGISVIEILIVIAIVVTVLTTLLGVATLSLRVSALIKKITIADALARETAEAVRSFRDGATWDATNGLGTLSVGEANPHYPATADSGWTLPEGTETINGFTRKVVFENVSRDGNNDIEDPYNSAHDDSNTRKATVTVSWDNKEVEIVTYLTNWQQ